MTAPVLRSFAASWERFWTRQGSPLSLALFRICFALVLWKEVATIKSKSRFAIEGGFHVPYVSFIQPLSKETFEWICWLQNPLVFLLAVGLFTRFSICGLLALQGYIFFTDYLNFRNHPYFFLLVLLLLLFSPAGEALSVRSAWRSIRSRRPLIEAVLGRDSPLTFQRLIQMQYCILYFYSALHKLHPAYLRGEVLATLLGRDITTGSSGRILGWFLDAEGMERVSRFFGNPHNMVLPAVLTVVIEMGLPFTLWSRKLRPFALLVGVLFHLNIAVMMNIMAFSLAMIAGYLLFLEPETLPGLVQRMAGKRPEREPVRSGPGSRSWPAARPERRPGAASSAVPGRRAKHREPR